MKNQVVLKEAILSEKAYALMGRGIYTFLVNESSTKDQIKKEVEKQFSTKVEKVRTVKVTTKTKKITGTRKSTTVGGGKKAVVYLVSGQSIAMFSPKVETKKKVSTSKVSDASKEENKKGILSKIRKPKEEEAK